MNPFRNCLKRGSGCKETLTYSHAGRKLQVTLVLACLVAVFANGASSPTNAAPATAPLTLNTNAPEALDNKHKLAVGDKLSYRILEDEEEPKPLTVTDSGDIEFPYVGRVPAESKTCKQLALEIKAALEKDYYYEATVILAVDSMAKTRGRIYLVGAVRLPGPQEIPSDETLTLSKAILRGGGFTEYSDKAKVKITRKIGLGETNKQTIVVDVGDIYNKGKTELDVPLEPGDLILIPDRKIRF